LVEGSSDLSWGSCLYNLYSHLWENILGYFDIVAILLKQVAKTGLNKTKFVDLAQYCC
jgi:hypothetical protein